MWLDYIFCQLSDIDGEIECMEGMLIGFIEAYAGVLPAEDPLAIVLASLAVGSMACAEANAVTTMCSDAIPPVVIDDCLV